VISRNGKGLTRVNAMTVITGESQIRIAQMLARRSALKLEMLGLKHSSGSIYALIKREHGLRGNKQSVYTQYCELIEKEKGKL
jgi:hypothetical protein